MSLYTLVVQNSDKTQEKEFQLDGVDILYKRGDVCDTFNVDSNGVATVTRRIGIDPATGESYILPNPITTTWGTLQIELYEGINYLKLLDDNNTVLSVAYILKNEFTDTYATRVEMNSSIEQSANNILLQVSQKYPEKDAIISSINLSPEEIAINSNKISLAGKTIQMTSDNIAINSTNFSVTKDGSITAKSGKIAGYTIDNNTLKAQVVGMCGLEGEEWAFWAGASQGVNAPFRVGHNGDTFINNATISGGKIELTNSSTSGAANAKLIVKNPDGQYSYYRGDGLGFSNPNSGDNLYLAPNYGLNVQNSSGDAFIGLGYMQVSGNAYAASFVNTSNEESKKNIKEFKDNAINIIKNTDIYEFNYKNEKDIKDKHIGIIIGDKYNYSKKITDNENNGVDLYSMISVTYKAIQEQQEIIENQQKQIDELKEQIKLLKEEK